jgi:hypothetical protein
MTLDHGLLARLNVEVEVGHDQELLSKEVDVVGKPAQISPKRKSAMKLAVPSRASWQNGVCGPLAQLLAMEAFKPETDKW